MRELCQVCADTRTGVQYTTQDGPCPVSAGRGRNGRNTLAVETHLISHFFLGHYLIITTPLNPTPFKLFFVLPPTTFDLFSVTPSPTPYPKLHPIPPVSHLFSGRPYRTGIYLVKSFIVRI